MIRGSCRDRHVDNYDGAQLFAGSLTVTFALVRNRVGR